MAVAVQIDVPDVTIEQYDLAIEVAGFLRGGPLPSGGLFHWVAKTDTGVRIVNVWATRELFEEFAETQAAIMREIGVDPGSLEIQFFDVHNYLSGPSWRG